VKDGAINIRRFVLAVVTVAAFFVSILEPIPRLFEDNYQSQKSPFTGLADEPLNLGSNRKFCEAFYDGKANMEIDFVVTPISLKDRYTNIFQTDDLNRGLRIEISPEGLLTAFVHSPEGITSEKVVGIVAADSIRSKTTNSVFVSVQKETLKIQVNDGPVNTQEGNFQPTCNRVLIGGGYDNSRSTIGLVQATVRVQSSDFDLTFGLPKEIRTVGRIIFTLLLLALVWEFRKKIFLATRTSEHN
jgi:hypothetical protein